MTKEHGESVAQVLATLEKHGPMTVLEMARRMGVTRDNLAAVVFRMSKATPRRPKRLYITGWVREVPQSRSILRAVYDIGDEPDAKRPKALTTLEATRRYRARQNVVRRQNFVFHLGRSLS